MPAAMRWILLIFSPFLAIYALLIFLRNKFYDWKWLRSCSVPEKVISVGNLQIGGTGKTPMVEFLAAYLLDRKHSVVILSRGYRRSFKDAVLVDSEKTNQMNPDLIGDEPYLLLQNLPRVRLAVAADRCESAKQAIKKWPDSVLLLDDGFQHRKMSRDLNILMIDPSSWSDGFFLFPLTDFRDNRSSLKRADLLIFNRTVAEPDFNWSLPEKLEQKLNVPVFRSSIIPADIIGIQTSDRLSLGELKNKRVAIFCGIAHPERFAEIVRELGGEICFEKYFRDHHRYRLTELSDIEKRARDNQVELILTTQKDAVKLTKFINRLKLNLYYLKIAIDVQPRQEFLNLIDSVLSAKN